jgi:ABC-type nitrate/sulfonate/bicarbonate transport system permease component
MDYKEDPLLKELNRTYWPSLWEFNFGLFCGFITGFFVGCVLVYYWT